MTSAAQSRCDHSGCKCPVAPGERYCSDACRMADEHSQVHAHQPVEAPCPCGHSSCHAAI